MSIRWANVRCTKCRQWITDRVINGMCETCAEKEAKR